MKNGPVENFIRKWGEAPQDVVDFYNKEIIPHLKKIATFQQMDDLAVEISSRFDNEKGEIFINDVRVALALNLEIQGVKFFVKRDSSIYLGHSTDVPANLGLLDAIVASRVLCPIKGSNNFGVLGKILPLRFKPELYYQEEISISFDTDEMAYEYNEELKEPCWHLKGTISTDSQVILEALLNDPNIVCCTAKVW